MKTLLIHTFAAYGVCSFIGSLIIIAVYGPRTYQFIRAEFFPQIRHWWRAKGAAFIIHHLFVWLFFAAFFSLVWVLDSKGLIWY